MSNERKIVAFHIGRGGRFNNPGHLVFIGEKKIGDFTDDLYTRYENEIAIRERLFLSYGEHVWTSAKLDGKTLEDVYDRLCADREPSKLFEVFNIEEEELGEIVYIGQNGEEVGLTQTEVDSGIGTINFDNDYDTVYTTYLEVLSDRELDAIVNSDVWNKEALLDEYAESIGFSEKELKLMRHFNHYLEALSTCQPMFKDGIRCGYIYGDREFTEHDSCEDLEEKYLEIDGKFYTKF